MFRDGISIPSSRVKTRRTAQFLPTPRRKPEILISCVSGRTEKQTVGSFVHKQSAVLPEPYLHTSCSETLCIIIPYSLYMHVIHTIYNSIHLHDMQDIRNLPISYITFYTISFRSNFVKKKKGGGPI